MNRTAEQRRYFAAGLCVLSFFLAQAYQELAYRFWIPEAQGSEQELLVYWLPADKIRAWLVLVSILSLVVSYAAVAIRYRCVAPMLSALGLLSGAAFVGFEISARSFEILVIGQHWAREFRSSDNAVERQAILRHFEIWRESIRGWYFPQMLAHLLAAVSFGLATRKDTESWARVATVAFFLNALRLLGRILSTYAGQAWLAGLNDKFYFPAVAVINLLLMVWFFHLAGSETPEPA